MEQHDSKPMDAYNSEDPDLQDFSTGARRLAKRLREMGNIPAPNSILPAVQVRLNLENEQSFQPMLIEALAQALRDNQWQMRLTAARMLGTLGEEAPRELINAILHDRDSRVRVAFLHTIRGQGKSKLMCRAAMIALQHDEESIVRTAAAQALSTAGSLLAVRALEKALTDDDAQVRTAALQALKMLRGRRQSEEEQVRHIESDHASSVLHQATLVVEQALKDLEDHVPREGNENGGGTSQREIARTLYSKNIQIIDFPLDQLGPYKLLQTLGSGGYAEVYRCRHVFLGTDAAVKVLHTSVIQDQIEQFLLEARIVANLIHPNIVRVLNFDVANNTPFLVMEYAANGSLRQRHRKGVPLPLKTVISYVEQIAQALQYAHDRGVIHCDIKPENMLLGQRGAVLLSDFGIAIGTHSLSMQLTHDIVGTIPYMAPEQIRGKPQLASDQYALGVVVYEWLCGAHPFRGTKWEILSQHFSSDPPALCERAPVIPRAVEQVVMKALAKDPNQRFRSISAFAHALSNASKETASISTNLRGRTGIGTTQHRKKRPPLLMVLLIIIALVCLFGSIVGIIASLFQSTSVIITPVHVSLARNYTVSAVTGPADRSQHQVHARLISAAPSPQSMKAQASGIGETQGTRARGTLTFFNGLSNFQTINAGTPITDADGIAVVTDEPAILPPADPPYLGSVAVPAHALDVGTNGNIAPESIDQTCCTDNKSITVKNLFAFSGGQDPHPFSFVRQSDIDRAAGLLETSLQTGAQTLLQGQVRPGESLLPIQCTHSVYSDHSPNDRTAIFTVTLTLTCNGEAYDKENAISIAIGLFKADAVKRLGDNYALTGTVTTDFLRVIPGGTKQAPISLLVKAEGIWTFQFKGTKKQELVRLIAGKSEKDARDLLLKQAGVSEVEVQTPWWVPWVVRNTLPRDSDRITLVINSSINHP